MSNWMNYHPSSTRRFWSYRQMTHHTRNPPISIRLAEKSKFRKWNVHNVMHHNGSDDQNIAGKYSMDNYRFHQSISQKSHFFFARTAIGRKSNFDPWPPSSHRDHRFVSIHLKRGYLTCFKKECPLENNPHDTKIRPLGQIKRPDPDFDGYF